MNRVTARLDALVLRLACHERRLIGLSLLRIVIGLATVMYCLADYNLAAYLVVFQTCMLYLTAGYWKTTGKVWQDGAAMYYISRLSGFEMSTTYAHLMSSAFLGTAICYFTIFTELAFPFAVLSARPWVRKTNTLAIEAMHLGIMACMGLVCFGLLMIGADCACLRDEDYRALYRWAARLKDTVAQRIRPTAGLDLVPTTKEQHHASA
ncbi:hypothetical protein P3T36_000023 [Kitasatospora sp. MAP12-15]|uniref:hypothetical protein n=1 Tax=unclassified Kitasatospora TaxID=2633591 RepID=UPI002475923D|nr:hypothetical protein [Kitasatospora sp. MAP12-44]MDH6109251.1 hypothetical protein [Kitasatospora sp. MAP12-44]